MAECNPKQEDDSFSSDRKSFRSRESVTSIGYITLPNSLLEASKLRRTHYNHPAIRLVETSFEVRRACNQAIIFAYGVSGSGASKTLNHLFSDELIPISDTKSETTTVTEYVTTLTSDHWKANNLEIGFINPPGYNDTKGEEQDVLNLSAIDRFIRGHELLGLHSYKCYPNIILITVSATDIRIDGNDSNVNKMLKALKHLNLVDNRNNNVLVVMTHAMGVPRKNFEENIKEQAESIKKIVKNSLGIDDVITVYVENCAESYQLEIDGDWTLLPDGTQQPLNLFEAMIHLMKNNGDEVGVEAVRLFFQGNVNPPQKRMVEPTGLKDEESFQRWCRVVIQKNILIQDNACTRALKHYLESNPNIPKDDLLFLMVELNKARITDPSALTGRSLYEVQKMVWPYQLTERDKKALIDVFKVRPLSYPQFLDEIARGCIDNELIPSAPDPIFNFVNGEKENIQLCNGVLLPSCMDIELYENTVVNCHCETIYRLEDRYTEIEIRERIEKEIQVANEAKQYTFVFSITHTVFSLPIQSMEQISNHITPEFKQSVYDLPDSSILPGEVGEEESEQKFHPQYIDFLNKYGHCFRTHWEGGGVITGKITVEIPEVEIQKTEIIIKQYLRLFARMNHQTKEPIQNEMVISVIQELLDAELTWRGGQAPAHRGIKLKEINSEVWENWKRSLIEDPIPLENIKRNFDTYPVYSLIKSFHEVKANQLKLVVDKLTDQEFDQEFDIDDIYSINKGSFILQNEICIDQQAEDCNRPRRESRAFLFADDVTRIIDDYCVIDAQHLVDYNRQKAARRARTDTVFLTSHGFPASATVRRKFQLDDLQSEEIKMKDLMKGNYVECISMRHRRAYVPIVDISKSEGEFNYIQIRHSQGAFSSGDLNNVMKGKKLKKTLVRKLRIRDKLVWVAANGTKVKTTRITELKLQKMEGNIQPCTYEEDHFHLIVDGIACGKKGAGCFPGNGIVTLRGGEKVRMDEVKIGDHVLSIHPRTGMNANISSIVSIASETINSLPRDQSELKYMLTSNHKASKLVGSSMKAHRSPYQSMVFLYGLSGSGKSSTLNHLFNSNLIPTSDMRSCTRSVIEYVATMDSPHWEVTGLDLGFVDTPGFGDTGSKDGDIENIAKIDEFLTKHPFLKSDLAPFKFYPNIVLIVSKITDDRMGGENSLFSKMLRILSGLNVVDKARPNAIIVLTCAISLRPQSKLPEKIDFVSNLARLYFEIDVPIVVVDNVTDGLDTEGDWTVLPVIIKGNIKVNIKQPLNLFQVMVSLMKESGDEIGIESTRLLFNNRKNIQIYEERKFGSDQGLFKDIVSKPNISKWSEMGYGLPKLYESQIKNRIISCIRENQIPHLTLTEETVLPLLYRLQQANIFNSTDLNDKNIEEVNRLLHPFQLNKEERNVLFELFQVEPLKSLDNIDRLGCGYLLSERILKFPIVSGKEMKYCHEIGVHIPALSHFNSRRRLLIHCQFEWVKPSMLSPRKPTVSFSVQYELFNLSIDVAGVVFEKAFVETANSLPRFETDPDKITMKAYKSFLDMYGTHCLLSFSYGGCISGSVPFPSTNTSHDMIIREASKLLWIFFETSQNYNQLIQDYKSIIDPNSHKLFDELMNASIDTIGGDDTFSNSKMEDINPAKWSKWASSLNRNFVLLEDVLYTVSISKLLKRNDKMLSKCIDRAVNELIGTDLPSFEDDKFIPVFESAEPHVWDHVDLLSRREASESVKSKCQII